MRYTITFREDEYEQLTKHLFKNDTVESAAYALCKLAVTENETRLLVREIIPVIDEDIIEANATGMQIKNISFLRTMKKADETKQLFIFIHSHPKDCPEHSAKDDIEEKILFDTAYTRIKTLGVHASVVLSAPDKPTARVWLKEGIYKPVSFIRVIGNKFRFFSNDNFSPLPQFFDRQIRAFGEEIQKVLKNLNIGIVGLGGTGSAIKEQLTRLGVGKLTLFDGQRFEITNVNRVYGSTINDEKVEKVKIAEKTINNIGIGTKVQTINKPITFRSSAIQLKDCDIVFGCTDDQWGRSILNRLSSYYHIPVFDMGVAINSKEQIIHSIQGRVTTLLHWNACLSCRNRITAKGIESENLADLDPDRFQVLVKQGYANELEDSAPSVIPFTTAIASLAVSEFIHRVTGYMGEERMSNEILFLFDESRVRTNRQFPKNDCICGDQYYFARGDVKPFLDLTWRQE